MKKQTICVLGSTGSIGRSTLMVASSMRSRFTVTALCAQSNANLLARQARACGVKAVAIGDESKYKRLKHAVGTKVRVFAGSRGIGEMVRAYAPDTTVVAISGRASLRPACEAIRYSRRVALASKEALVSAGHLIMRYARKYDTTLVPIDSEHNALFQCLQGVAHKEIRRLIITASGGSMRGVSRARLRTATPARVLKHPKWKMGKKITVDSATMMNKGLEVIEAQWLFGMDITHIDVMVHPEAIVHSMVECVDGSILAQLGVTDMRLPIHYALTYPKRRESIVPRLELTRMENLSFFKPDVRRFPALRLAYEAAMEGGSVPCVLNAANETCVKNFLAHRIRLTDIPLITEKVMRRHTHIPSPSLQEIETLEAWADKEAERLCIRR